MVLSNTTQQNASDPIVLNSYAETLICKFCGKEYISRGKYDLGYCKECGAELRGGPLDGRLAGELKYDDSGSETETG